MRVAELQRAGIEIRAVIELVRDLQNTFGRLLLDAGFIVQDLGDRCNGYTGPVRDLANGCHEIVHLLWFFYNAER